MKIEIDLDLKWTHDESVGRLIEMEIQDAIRKAARAAIREYQTRIDSLARAKVRAAFKDGDAALLAKLLGEG